MKLSCFFGALLSGGIVAISLNAFAQDDWAKLPPQTAPATQPAKAAQTNQPVPVAQIPQPVIPQAAPATQFPQTAAPAQPVQVAQPASGTLATQTAKPVKVFQPPQAPEAALPAQAIPAAAPTAQAGQPIQPAVAVQPVQTIPATQPMQAAQPEPTVQAAQPVQAAQVPQPIQPAPVTQQIAQPEVAAQPAVSTQPAQPAAPVQQVVPTQPAVAIQPAPVQTAPPVQPTQVTQVPQPAQPDPTTQTVQAVTPVQVAQPVQPAPVTQQVVQPAVPTPSVATAQPTAVAQPVAPAQSIAPVQAVVPTQSVAVVQPVPAQSVAPAQPVAAVPALQPVVAVQPVATTQPTPMQPVATAQAASAQPVAPIQPVPVQATSATQLVPAPMTASAGVAQPTTTPATPAAATPATTKHIELTPAVEELTAAPVAELAVPAQAAQSAQSSIQSVMSAPATQPGQPASLQATPAAQPAQPAAPVQMAMATTLDITQPAPTVPINTGVSTQPGQVITLSPRVQSSLPVTLAGQIVLDAADVIIINAKVLMLDSNFTVAQAIAVRSNIVLAVGRNKEVAVYQGPLTRVYDAQGRTVMPGLYDGYVQSSAASISELRSPLPALDSIAAAQEYIRRQSTNRPAGSWIVLTNLFPTRVKEGRLPTKAELDAAAPNNPVVWHLGTLAIANSKALDVSHIVKESSEPKGGIIVRDRKTFKPTGVLKNAAISLLRMPPAPPAPNVKQRREALKSLYALYNQHGITSIAEQNAGTNDIDLFRDLSASNELSVRINVSRTLDPGTNDIDGAVAVLEAMVTNTHGSKIPYGPTGAGDDWVRMGALSFHLDGDVSLAGAYLRTPYGIGPTYDVTEPAYRGELKPDPHVMSDLCFEAASRGWQLSAYCSGDAALDFALNCYERVQFQTNVQDRRFAITHNDFQGMQNWVRCSNLNVVANLQPTCLNLDGASLLKTLGEPRLAWFMPIKTWLDRGLVVGAGSDHRAGTNSFDSVSPWNPWLGIWITLTRETDQGTVLNPGERITREQAIRLYTYNNAWNHFEERKKGTLELGKYADLIMIDTDILECPVDDIRATGVLLTMVNGKVVWESRNNWTTSTAVSALRSPDPK